MHKLLKIEASDGILSGIMSARCSCGWSGSTFVDASDNLKSVRASLRKRFNNHAKGVK